MNPSISHKGPELDWINSITLESGKPILISKKSILLSFCSIYLSISSMKCPIFLLVQRLNFGLKQSGIYSIVSNMIFFCVFQWFAVFHFEFWKFLSIISMNSAIYWKRESLFIKTRSITKVNVIWIPPLKFFFVFTFLETAFSFPFVSFDVIVRSCSVWFEVFCFFFCECLMMVVFF